MDLLFWVIKPIENFKNSVSCGCFYINLSKLKIKITLPTYVVRSLNPEMFMGLEI
jgi:hypothetical protein